ncbi:NADPH:quinone reductase [Actinoplanes italicus]|uniref:NADPH:quinone reductase-like Zn-dependent oxidoreductase n=1 Tax=Actinoplanes italicus TaxID=113567 RepID=A0A2T0K610_9ACTN|nr:NADP-dependent oxidoreductase [Actinoplanes italicus]PRX18394.1 NADPH:quinone reductase-like Zn-dependent oxidoreductase [Actinoplanes italicus]GIE32803.1 NADPH:quinone reductase [Actinoplanes italicus]
MEAIVFDRFGGPEVLRMTEVGLPEPGPGQVRLRVVSAAVNPVDHKIRNGWLEAVFPTVFPAVPGWEAAGVVDEVGEGVTGLASGDEVFGFTDTGSYAGYALATVVARKPAALSWDEAAALPVAGETAQRVLDLLAVTGGETVLVHGAAGAVGGLAVQLAVARGATVIGTASAANHDHLRSLGVIPVTYGDGLADRVRALAPRGVDAVFDAAGQGAVQVSVELRGTTDRIITIADAVAAQEAGVPFSAGGERTAEALAALADLAVAGRLHVEVADTYPLAEAAKAQEQSATGHTRGKLLLHP